LLRIRLSPINTRYVNEAYGYLILSSLWVASHLSRIIRYRHPYWALQSYFLKKTHLLDDDFYLRTYVDVEQDGFRPTYHFAAFGDKEGRSPNPLFEPRFYRSKSHGRLKNVNSLLHYFYIGQYRRYSPSAWFDIQFYIANNRDVLNSGYEPLRHYLEFGGLEGRSPNPQFDGKYYLGQHPELFSAFKNPLLHFIEYGQLHGLPTRDMGDMANQVSKEGQSQIKTSINSIDASQKIYEKILKEFQYSQLYSIKVNCLNPVVDIIIPVYKNTLATLKCISSVMNARGSSTFELIIINDKSPEFGLTKYLQEFSRLGILTLVENSQNKGFVYSVNRGMQLHSDRDVILLNSDTQVFNDWIDRLIKVADSHPMTGSVTPLSNNATICSYPRTLHDNPYPLDIAYKDLDHLASQVNQGKVVEAPTGVGFCLYLKRAALEGVGLFDEKAFGTGYGEENDWCQRAIQSGWKNIITADTFVYHIGGSSFGGAKEARLDQAMKTIAKRYPKYHQSIKDFIKKDPLRDARESLDWGRLQLQARKENTLMISHNRGGGSERHLQEDAQKILDKGGGVFYLRPVRFKPHLAHINHQYVKQLFNLPNYELKNTELLAEKLRALNIATINIHGLVDFEAKAPIHIAQLASVLNVRQEVDLHDYTVICPRINLVNKSGIYCGEPPEAECNKCLAELPNDFGETNIQQWRKIHYESLKAADSIFAPSQDVHDRIRKYYPDLIISIQSHKPLKPDGHKKHSHLSLVSKKDTNVFKVLVIGAISYIKGYNALHAIAKDALKRGLPLKYVVQGHTINNLKLNRQGVEILGSYLEEEAVNVCRSVDPDIIFFTSIWPETYSYTLDIAFDSGYPVMAFDIGAIPERLKGNNWLFELVSLDKINNPSAINDQILKFKDSITRNED
jgi:GT2 family glycosyltransferase/glycosyltransferase involved in cell wall biosynthesis